MPDTTRYCKKPKDGIIGSICGFIGGEFVIAFPCFIIALGYQNIDFISIVINNSVTVALFILLTAMWSNNDNNLYAIALSFATIFKNVKRVYLIKILIILLGIILANMEFIKLLIPFLSLLSIVVPSIAGLYVLDFFLNRPKHIAHKIPENGDPLAFVCWLVGSCVACLAYFNYIVITTIPAVDGCIVSVALCFLIFECRKRIPMKSK